MKQKTLFPDNLKTVRCFNKMSCVELGEKIKLDGKRLAEVERGRLHETFDEIKALAKFSGYSEYVLCNIKLEMIIMVNPKSV